MQYQFWNQISERPIRIITEEFTSEIISIILDETDRKVILGDPKGKILMVDSLSGRYEEFCSHNGEVAICVLCNWR